MMRIYFAGSIRGGRELQPTYAAIIERLQSLGHIVLSEHIGKDSLTDKGELRDDIDIYNRDLVWINQSDVMIADVTVPSLGVGYEVCYAQVFLRIPILCIAHTDANVSAMISGSGVKLLHYNHTEHAIMTVHHWMSKFETEKNRERNE